MSLHVAPRPVKLDSNSLYISTIPLLANACHWALVHIDQNGVATRHQWAATTQDPQGPEAYVEQAFPEGPTSKLEKDHILAYFKISDYRPVDVTELRRICASTFSSSYLTAQDNRRADITCRTWITRVLSQLMSPERAREIEEQRPYEVQVFTL